MNTSTQKFPIVEIFKSIEGEGIRSGLPTTFVRFAECNLRCSYCDTLYAQTNKECAYKTREEIYAEIVNLGLTRVTFTGGEPLLKGGNFIDWFINNCPQYDINIETNGSMEIEYYLDDNTTITMDYKCKSSGHSKDMKMCNFKYLRTKDVLKFVVGSEEDLIEVRKVLLDNETRCIHNFVHPIFGQIELKTIADFIMKNAYLNLRLGVQLHKLIWEPSTRGV